MEAILTLDKHFTIKQVAGMLQVHERTVRRWIKAERLRAIKMMGQFGKEYRIPLSALRDAGFEVVEKPSNETEAPND